MNRTSEFFKIVHQNRKEISKNDKISEKDKISRKEISKSDISHNKFYDCLNERIQELFRSIENSCSYKSILVLEDRISKLQNEVLMLDSIELEEQGEIFEGIKYILKYRIGALIKQIRKKKRNDPVELEEERPQMFKHDSSASKTTPKHNLQFQEQLQIENRKIIGSQEYEQTRKRLMKIEKVQLAINEHLCVQNERIDEICDTVSNSNKIYSSISGMGIGDAGSFVRRFVFVLLLCLSFVLLFLHVFYRSK